jgi:hypothetical protein
MASTEVAHDSGLTRGSVVRWAALAAVAAVAIVFLGSRLHNAFIQTPNVTPVAASSVSSSHCSQFIELAKAKFGPDWKYRLDPRDTTCAQAIQEQWQHEWNARLPIQPTLPPTMPIVTASEPPVVPSDGEARIRNPETYCLNVISLARSRYGADWASKVSPEGAANCAEEIRRAASQ